MTQQCVNCPGAEDHSTAQCPVMAEASAVVNQQVTAADSLPVGVPDGYMPIPTAEQIADALESVRCFHDMSAELIAPELLANLLAATTVKAEQVQCEVCHGQGEVYSGHDQHFHYFDFQPPEPIMEVCPECGGEEAPSLPAAGSADLTAVRCQCCATEYPHDSYDAGFIAGSGMCQVCDAAMPPKDWPAAGSAELPEPDFTLDGGSQPCYYAETVQRIVAALSAHQSAHVSVPRELLGRAMYAKDGRELIEANRELRALLASHGREVEN